MKRKKCLNCMWIGTTNDYKCCMCNNTLVDADGPGNGGIRTVLRRRDKYGNIIYENPEIDKIRVKGHGHDS